MKNVAEDRQFLSDRLFAANYSPIIQNYRNSAKSELEHAKLWYIAE